MNDFWLNNLYILINKKEEFYPNKDMSNIEKANALARFGIYYGIIICLLNLDTKWLSVSLIFILLSLWVGLSENFTTNKSCTKPTLENPYMNFTLGDMITNPFKAPACNTDDVRNEEIKLFRTNSITGETIVNPLDLYGTNINDRNFYTMPSTTIVNDQNAFANFVYGDFGKCKSTGQDCLKHIDNIHSRGRYYR